MYWEGDVRGSDGLTIQVEERTSAVKADATVEMRGVGTVKLEMGKWSGYIVLPKLTPSR